MLTLLNQWQVCLLNCKHTNLPFVCMFTTRKFVNTLIYFECYVNVCVMEVYFIIR